MNLHEYQAKSLFSAFGIGIPYGIGVCSGSAARVAASAIGGEFWAVKAQVHAGSRGKAGGVKIAKSLTDVEKFTVQMLGQTLVTEQTGPAGLPVSTVLIEQGLLIARELYISLLVDRMARRIAIIGSSEGGMHIEDVATRTPENILSILVDPAAGLQAYQCRQVGLQMGLGQQATAKLQRVLVNLYQFFLAVDAQLVEVNPLVVTVDDRLVALDGKVAIDDNALFRHPGLAALRDRGQEDEREISAAANGLNYVALDGNIGCLVNGAGLAMATMDIIKLHGGDPANFLDVGGSATVERVADAFRLVLSGAGVDAILVNIFGGIVRCDMVARGIIAAADSVGLKIPVVVRLQGTNVDEGRELLGQSSWNIVTVDDLTAAAKQVVAAAR